MDFLTELQKIPDRYRQQDGIKRALRDNRLDIADFIVKINGESFARATDMQGEFIRAIYGKHTDTINWILQYHPLYARQYRDLLIRYDYNIENEYTKRM